MWPALRIVDGFRLRFRPLPYVIAIVFVLAYPARSHAQVVSGLSTPAKDTLDAQLVLALPAALATGLSTGVGANYNRLATKSGTFAYGASASWSTATEYTLTESVRNDDIRLRLCGIVQRPAGRGIFALRLSAGGTLVYEDRTRAQGNRAGLSGSALDTTTWSMLPAADAEGVVFLRVWESWGMSISGGPTLHIVDSGARWGWTSGLGVTWQH
jgi:hypothetical protein